MSPRGVHFATKDFVDFLKLVRTGGTWHIMAKVFQITERDT